VRAEGTQVESLGKKKEKDRKRHAYGTLAAARRGKTTEKGKITPPQELGKVEKLYSGRVFLNHADGKNDGESLKQKWGEFFRKNQ